MSCFLLSHDAILKEEEQYFKWGRFQSNTLITSVLHFPVGHSENLTLPALSIVLK